MNHWTLESHSNCFLFTGKQNLPSQACALVHFSLHSPGNHRSCQNLLSCHHQSEFWSQIQKSHQGLSCTFLPTFPWFLFWGRWPSQDEEHQSPKNKLTGCYKNKKQSISSTTATCYTSTSFKLELIHLSNTKYYWFNAEAFLAASCL